MGYFLTIVGLIGVPVCLIILIILLIRKKRLKPVALTMAGLFVCFVVGMIIISETTPEEEAVYNAGTTMGTTAEKSTEASITSTASATTTISTQTTATTSAPIPTDSEEDYMNSCEEIAWKTLARDPEQYIGKKIMVKGEVSQILSGGWLTMGGCRVYEDYDLSTGDTWYQNEWFMSLDTQNMSPKILDNDVITFYGEFAGTTEITRSLTGTKEEVITLDVVCYTIHE